ncbi:hypothetical protein [Dactylosporangium sp. NPDC051541]|uniref:hypothetical protein n=1 Tax=Dactylosporangium sp. NPDC051541 TaxID=3363977 RepID=UPI0037B3B733
MAGGFGAARLACGERLLQRRLVDLLPLNIGIRALPPPFEVAPLIEAMWWHPVYDADPEHAYLRDVLTKAARQAIGPADTEVQHS